MPLPRVDPNVPRASAVMLVLLAAGCAGPVAPPAAEGMQVYPRETAAYQASIGDAVLWNISVELWLDHGVLKAEVLAQPTDAAWQYRSLVMGGSSMRTYEIDLATGAVEVARVGRSAEFPRGAAALAPVDMGVVSSFLMEETLTFPDRMALPIGPQWALAAKAQAWGPFAVSHASGPRWSVEMTAPCEYGCYLDLPEPTGYVRMSGSTGLLPERYETGLQGATPVVLDRVAHSVQGKGQALIAQAPAPFAPTGEASCHFAVCDGEDWPADWSFEDPVAALLRDPRWWAFADGTWVSPWMFAHVGPYGEAGTHAGVALRFVNGRGEANSFLMVSLGVDSARAWVVQGVNPFEPLVNASRYDGTDWRHPVVPMQSAVMPLLAENNMGLDDLQQIWVTFHAASDVPDVAQRERVWLLPPPDSPLDIISSLATGEVLGIAHG